MNNFISALIIGIGIGFGIIISLLIVFIFLAIIAGITGIKSEIKNKKD